MTTILTYAAAISVHGSCVAGVDCARRQGLSWSIKSRMVSGESLPRLQVLLWLHPKVVDGCMTECRCSSGWSCAGRTRCEFGPDQLISTKTNCLTWCAPHQFVPWGIHAHCKTLSWFSWQSKPSHTNRTNTRPPHRNDKNVEVHKPASVALQIGCKWSDEQGSVVVHIYSVTPEGGLWADSILLACFCVVTTVTWLDFQSLPLHKLLDRI